VPLMRKITKIVMIMVCIVVTASVAAAYALFHGYFDRGQFAIEQAQWSSSTRIAVIAKRSDHEALSSDIRFVLIGDHLFSPTELRHAYYRHEAIFAAASDCLTLRWESPRQLVVACDGSSIDSDHVNVQKLQSGEIAISYANIPIK
jgi:hypothetical protein